MKEIQCPNCLCFEHKSPTTMPNTCYKIGKCIKLYK